jgi:hypothetical protein
MAGWRKDCASVLVLPFLGAAVSGAAPYPVQVWKQSDDGLTNKLADSIETAIKRSSHLSLSSAKAPGTLYLIVSQALWQEKGSHTRVTYFVNYGRSSNDPEPITRAHGSCWDFQLDRCAAEIVETAEAIAPEVK